MKIAAIACVAALALQATRADAITWSSTTVADPFAEGKTCNVAEPMSSGSYIYDYPEKWDGVYWPHTDEQWVWRCESSGYVAFADEFEKLTPEQKVSVAEWLKQNGPAKLGVEGSLARIIELEQFRSRVPGEAAWFKRLMAWWASESDPAQADAYRRESIPLMLEALKTAPEEDKVQLAFLVGVYAERFFGPFLSDIWFGIARRIEWKDDDNKTQVGIPYFNEMIDEVVARRQKPRSPG